jgi:hypothetical protein
MGARFFDLATFSLQRSIPLYNPNKTRVESLKPRPGLRV